MIIIDRIIDAVYPRRCPVCHEIVRDKGKNVCNDCKKKLNEVRDPYCITCGKPVKSPEMVHCSYCSNNEVNFSEGRAVFVYDDTMRKSIYRFKYNGRQEYSKFYAEEIYNKYRDKILQWDPQIIVPIPIHKSKLKKRGYNQAYLIAKELSYLTKIPVNNRLLYRAKKTEIQKNLSASDRKSNLKNAFKISSNKVQYLSAMLIDDIYTTGATMNNASAALKDSGIHNVYCISLSIGIDY